MRARSRWFFVVAALVTLVGCDHATKLVAKRELENDPPHYLIGRVLDLRYVENRDIAFSALRFIPDDARRPILIVVQGAIILGLGYVLSRRRVVGAVRVALVLALAGALGNYLDRLFRGYVVDFIHVPYWPVFNLADAYLVAGMGLLLLTGFRLHPPPEGAAT